MKVAVCYALPDRQTLVELEVEAGATALSAVRASGILEQHPELDADALQLGIYGRKVTAGTELRDGDRVEVLRPLLADPREVRRQLAAEGRTMGERED